MWFKIYQVQEYLKLYILYGKSKKIHTNFKFDLKLLKTN